VSYPMTAAAAIATMVETVRAREVAAAYQASVQRVLTELLISSPMRCAPAASDATFRAA
jgi:hypothetical protein